MSRSSNRQVPEGGTLVYIKFIRLWLLDLRLMYVPLGSVAFSTRRQRRAYGRWRGDGS